MTEITNKFKLLEENYVKLKQQFQTEAQVIFKDVFKNFFDKNPAITAVIWNQYTPYFNDGDTCEFNVNEISFTNAPDLELIDNYGELDESVPSDVADTIFYCDNLHYVMSNRGDYYKREAALISQNNIDVGLCSELSSMMHSDSMTEVLESMFGDHVRVVATKDGFSVEEYSHD